MGRTRAPLQDQYGIFVLCFRHGTRLPTTPCGQPLPLATPTTLRHELRTRLGRLWLMARLNAGMDRLSGHCTNLLLLQHARTWLRHLLNDSNYRDRVDVSAYHRELSIHRLGRRLAPRNFSHRIGSYRIRCRPQRPQPRPLLQYRLLVL
jgi:hypothetical protein